MENYFTLLIVNHESKSFLIVFINSLYLIAQMLQSARDIDWSLVVQ